jgi:imidazoleglycerol phosphate dehydratase HisB
MDVVLRYFAGKLHHCIVDVALQLGSLLHQMLFKSAIHTWREETYLKMSKTSVS